MLHKLTPPKFSECAPSFRLADMRRRKIALRGPLAPRLVVHVDRLGVLRRVREKGVDALALAIAVLSLAAVAVLVIIPRVLALRLAFALGLAPTVAASVARCPTRPTCALKTAFPLSLAPLDLPPAVPPCLRSGARRHSPPGPRAGRNRFDARLVMDAGGIAARHRPTSMEAVVFMWLCTVEW